MRLLAPEVAACKLVADILAAGTAAVLAGIVATAAVGPVVALATAGLVVSTG